MKVDLEKAMAQEELRAARKPNPVAPKTDTPATQPKMVDDPVNGLVRMRIVQAAKESAKRRGMKEPDIHCVYTAGVLLLAEAESTLAAERASLATAIQQRDQFLGDRKAATQDYMAERASRVQADTEQFNAGIERAAQYVATMAAYPYANPLTDDTKSILGLMPNGIRNCAKPSVSPEQEKP